MTTWRNHIGIDPRICHGQPCIKGTRIPVSLLLDFLANGDSEEAILGQYPSLRPDDLHAALAYAAELMKERIIPLESGHAA